MKSGVLLIFILGLFVVPAYADGIYRQSIKADYKTTYKKLYQSLEDNRFFVINEINLGKNLAALPNDGAMTTIVTSWKIYRS